MARLEHVNITVEDPDKTAEMLCGLFGWSVRWKGDAIHGGRTVHVGSAEDYVALYTGPGGGAQVPADTSNLRRAGLNHIGVVVENLEATETAVKALGFETHSHADYEPGRRFYFSESNGLEIEVVCYASGTTE